MGPDCTLFVTDLAARRLVATFASGLAVFDAASRKLVKRLQTGRGAGIHMDASSYGAFVLHA